jgi:phosphatidylinositol 4-kinase
MWFLITLFQLAVTDEDNKHASATEWRRPALVRIASQTPPLISEEAHDALVNDVEFNPSIRLEYARNVRLLCSLDNICYSNVRQVIPKHRTLLTQRMPQHGHEIRALSSGQVIFLLTMHDIENMRSAAGFPSMLMTYFTNSALAKYTGLATCMEATAEKVMRDSIYELTLQAREQSLPDHLSNELQALLVGSTHRVARARDVAAKYLNKLITSFPSLMCDPPLVFAILEVLTLLRRACENEFIDEVRYDWGARARCVLKYPDERSITPTGSTTLSVRTLRCSSATTTRSATISLRHCSGARASGSSLRSLVHQSSCRRLCRYVQALLIRWIPTLMLL